MNFCHSPPNLYRLKQFFLNIKLKFMKKIMIVVISIFALNSISTAQDQEVIGEAGMGCISRTSNNGYCNKFSGAGSLPSYVCEATSCHGTTCPDCIK